MAGFLDVIADMFAPIPQKKKAKEVREEAARAKAMPIPKSGAADDKKLAALNLARQLESQRLTAPKPMADPLLSDIQRLENGTPGWGTGSPGGGDWAGGPVAEEMSSGHEADGDWLQMALAALGGGPDRNAYISPFVEAEGKTRAAHAAAMPAIASAYDKLRGSLQQSGAAAQQGAAQAQQNMVAQQGQLQQQQTAAMNPVIADLLAQGAGTGQLQAQVQGNQQALQTAALSQQQLGQNVANATQQSNASRVADVDTSLTEANMAAGRNLDQILGQIGVQKAGAERQYASAASEFDQKKRQIELTAMERGQARKDKASDPYEGLLRQERALKAEQNIQKMLTGGGAQRGMPRPENIGPDAVANQQAGGTAWGQFEAVIVAAGEKGDRMKAEKILAEDIADAKANKMYDPKTNSLMQDGKRISVDKLRSWLDRYYQDGDDAEANGGDWDEG